MHKKFFYLFIIVLFQTTIFPASAQKINWATAPINPIAVKYTLNHFQLNGPVEVIESRELLNFGETESASIFNSIKKTFSKEGLLMLLEEPISSKYYYDSGKLIKTTHTDIEHIITNATGLIIERRPEKVKPIKYSYTKKGQLAEISYGEDGKRIKYIYDDKDRLMQAFYIRETGKVYNQIDYKYSTTKSGMLKILSLTKYAQGAETVDQVKGYYSINVYNVQGDVVQSAIIDTTKLNNARVTYEYLGNKLQALTNNQLRYQASIKYFTAQLPSKEALGCKEGNCINGYGRFKYKDKEYVGFFENGNPSGFGSMNYKDGSSHYGNWLNGLKEGCSIFTLANGKYKVGMYHNDLPDGFSEDFTGAEPKYELYSNNKLVKDFKVLKNDSTNRCRYGNCTDGYGIFMYESGDQFKGFFKNGFPKMGALHFKNGDVYQGSFNDVAQFDGFGVYKYPNGNRYDGSWLEGKYNFGGINYNKAKNEYTIGWYVKDMFKYAL